MSTPYTTLDEAIGTLLALCEFLPGETPIVVVQQQQKMFIAANDKLFPLPTHLEQSSNGHCTLPGNIGGFNSRD